MIYSVEYLDKYVKVINKKTNEIVASGKVIFTKNSVENNGISFDNKWFFRETDNLKLEIVDFIETKLCDNPEKLGLKCSHLLQDFPKDIDVLRDYGYDELDPEIKDYVYGFNEISYNIKTVTSCCGHHKKPWYIEFEFNDFDELSKFINIVETFGNQLILTSLQTAGKIIKKKKIHLMLKPTVEDFELKLLDKFYKKVKLLFG